MLPFGLGFISTISTANIQSTIAVVYLGIFPGAVAYLCWTAVLSGMVASKASTSLYIVPVVTILIGFVRLAELPSLISITGGMLAIGGVIISHIKKTV